MSEIFAQRDSFVFVRGETDERLATVIPACNLALVPSALFGVSIFVSEMALAILFPVLPVAFVLAAICPSEDAVALLAVIHEFSFVYSAVAPFKNAPPMHLVVGPRAHVVAPVAPSVSAVASDVVQAELPSIAGPVVPKEFPHSVLRTIDVGTLIASLVWPNLTTFPMLFVFLPLSFVHGTVEVDVFPCPIGLVILPLALVNVPIRVD